MLLVGRWEVVRKTPDSLEYQTNSVVDIPFDMESNPWTETFGQGETWSGSWLNTENDDLVFADDTIFGFFTQE